MKHLHRLVLALCLLLSACGGGGGGGSAGSFTLSTHTAHFSANRGGTAPASQSIHMHLTDKATAVVGAGYANGQQPPSWLGVNITGGGSDFDVVLTITDTSLAAGSYSVTLTVGTADANQNILQTQDVAISYDLANQLAFTGAPPTATLVLGSSQSTQSIPFNVAGDGIRYSVSSSAGWLKVPSGTFSGSQSISLTVDEAGLDAGQYQANVTVTDLDKAGDSATAQVSLTVSLPSFGLSPSTVLLGGADGLNTAPVPLSLSLNTGTNAYPWTAVLSTNSGGAWLKSSAVNGTVGSGGASLTLDANRAKLPSGTYTGQMQIQATVAGHTVSAALPVTLNLAANLLSASFEGVAFSQFPSRHLLTRDLTVSSTLGSTTTPWQAAADQSWLNVTSSGTTGGTLTLTANPTGLAPDRLYQAKVTISSSDPSVQNQETVRVGLWIGSTNPVTASAAASTNEIATNPVLPYAYVSSGGNSISVYNVYTGALVTTFNNVGQLLTGMTLSSDGTTLFANDNGQGKTVAMDASTGVLSATQYPIGGAVLVYAKPQGHAVLVAANGAISDVATGAQLATVPFGFYYGSAGSLAVTADGQHLYAQDDGISGSTFVRYDLAYSALNGGKLTATYFGRGSGGSNGQDIAVSADGARLYTANGAPYDCAIFDGMTLAGEGSLAGNPYPGNVEVGWNGEVFCGSENGYANPDVLVYDANGNSLGGLSSGGNLVTGQLKLSGDVFRMVTLTSGGTLTFQNAP